VQALERVRCQKIGLDRLEPLGDRLGAASAASPWLVGLDGFQLPAYGAALVSSLGQSRRSWTRADRVITSLVEARARATGASDRSIEPTAQRRDALSTAARRAIVAGSASLIMWTIARIVLT
jgi:hypothetical protein